MTTRYIVKFRTIVNEDFSLDSNVESDGFAEFSEYKNSRITIPNISVRTCENKNDENNVTLFSKHITSNFGDVVFEDEEKKCYIKYFDGYLIESSLLILAARWITFFIFSFFKSFVKNISSRMSLL